MTIVAMTACGGSDNNSGDNPNNDSELAKSIVGSWHLTSWSSSATFPDVYISFDASGNFELYQLYENPGYEYYTGKYSVSNDVLTGVYSDNVAWACSYAGSVNSAGTQLTLVSQDDDSITSVYTKESIPDDVKNAVITKAGMSRSGQEGRWL